MNDSENLDIWQGAKRKIDKKELEYAFALGFDRCEQCGEWFHHEPEDWVDCASCGRYCVLCAELAEWESCDRCGFTYCQSCYGMADRFSCPVCSIVS